MQNTKRNKVRESYHNEKQIEFLRDLTPTKFLHASRGFGKTRVIAPQSIIIVNNLPGSRGLLTCESIKQAKSSSLTEMEAAWNSFGMKAEVHYSFKRTRPEAFAKPIAEPKSEDIIWFANGACCEIVASRQFDSARGRSFDFILGDEMAFFPEVFMDDIVMPSLRGNQGKFMVLVQDFLDLNGLTLEELQKYRPTALPHHVIVNPFHHMVCLFTSPPKKAKGKWIYRYEQYSKDNPNDFSWMEATVYDNLDAYGRKTLERNKLTMSKKSFDRELGGKKNKEAEMKWYFNFNEDIHTFEPSTNYLVEDGKLYVSDSYSDRVHNDKVLDLSFDFSGWFNGCLVSQTYKRTEVIHDFLYVKEDSNVDNLVDMFCKKYKDHSYKVVRIYGDRIGHDRTPFGKTLFQTIAIRLRYNGWGCEIKVPKSKKTDEHSIRHKNMNEILAESNGHLPILRMNKNTCKDLIIGLNYVDALPDFKKDKSMEKDKTFPQEHAPHGSDMLDYLIHQKYIHKFRTLSIGSGMDYNIF